jgi:hypothetical protein
MSPTSAFVVCVAALPFATAIAHGRGEDVAFSVMPLWSNNMVVQVSHASELSQGECNKSWCSAVCLDACTALGFCSHALQFPSSPFFTDALANLAILFVLCLCHAPSVLLFSFSALQLF